MELNIELLINEQIILFTNTCNGFSSNDPKADFVIVADFDYDTVKNAEKKQVGVGRVGGNWEEALKISKMSFRKILKGNESEFTKEPFTSLITYNYQVIAGNY